MAMETIAQKRLKGLIKKLGSIRGRHTELITIYVPAGANLNIVGTQVTQEQGTAANIKSKTVRKNVLGALEKVAQHLKLYRSTPPNGLAIFCGNVSEKEGDSDIELWAIEPPEKLNQRLYRCDQTFVLDPLKHMVREKEIYGLIVLDKSDSEIGLLAGKRIESLKHIESLVPGKTKKGGWCVHEDSFMQLSDGRIKKVSEIGSEKFVSYDFSRMTRAAARHAHYFVRKSNEALRISTKAPSMSITVTPEHKFFVPTPDGFGTKAAGELSAGERLLCLRSLDFSGSMQSIEAEAPVIHRVTEQGRKFLAGKRRSLGLTQRQVAEKAGVSQTFISKFERGEREPGSDLLERILGAYALPRSAMSRVANAAPAIKWPNMLTRDAARFIGYFIGDGGIEKNRLTLNEGDRALAEEYSRISEKLFGVRASPRKRGGRNYHETRLHSRHLCDMLRKSFPEVFKNSERDIPESITMSPPDVVAHFIGGIWDAEGYATKSNGSAGITMKERHIIAKLQLLLLRFGIISSMKAVPARGSFARHMRYALVITDGESLLRFSKHIPLLSAKKAGVLSEITKTAARNTYTDQIPFLGSHVLRLIHELGLTTDDFPKVQDFFFDRKGMSYPVFHRNIMKTIEKKLGSSPKAAAALSSLRSMAESGLISARIKSIEKVRPDGKFYDMEVPKYRNFMANGIIVHNSQARYARVREGLLNDHLKKTAEIATSYFRETKDMKGILIGGPGPIKDMFFNSDHIPTDIKSKVIGVIDTSYTGVPGLEEMIARAEDILAEASVTRERKLLERFFSELSKDNGLAVYGIHETLKALESGSVEILLVSEDFDLVEVEGKCSACGKKIRKMVKKDKIRELKCDCGGSVEVEKETDGIEVLDKFAENVGTKLEIVSVDTHEGEQLYEMGGLAGILRYR